MPLKDRNIGWQRKSRFITVGEMIAGSSVDASGVTNGMGAGAPDLTEVSSFGYGSGRVGAAGDTWAVLDFTTPREMDIEEEIGVRVHYCTLGTVATTDDITWIVLYDQVDVGEAMIAAATALDTTIAEHRQGVATTLLTHRTARGIIDAGKFDETARGGHLLWTVEADAIDYSTNEVGLLGLEIDYMPRLTYSNGEPLGDLNKNLAGA